MEALPDDLVTEIFSYLPAKSAARCHSLSCSWRAMLKSASFVQLHIRRANKPGELKVFFSLSDDTMEEEPDNHEDAAEEESDDEHSNAPEQQRNDHNTTHAEDGSDEGNTTHEEEESDDGNTTEEEEEPYFYSWQPGGVPTKLTPNNFCLPTPLTRPLHGLILIRCRETGYHVFNPCTGASFALPDTKLPLKMILRPCRRQVMLPYYLYVAYGLGYCSVTGEYKVVRMLSKFTDNGKYSPILCEVFVLGMLAYWRPASQQPPACVVKEDNPGVFLSGHLHFLCDDGGILSFDVSGEMFSSVLPPPSAVGDVIKMTELDGCLCVCHGDIGYTDSSYRLWVMRNYKERVWEQLYHVDPIAWAVPEWLQLESSWMAPLYMYKMEKGQKKIIFGTGNCKVFMIDVPNGKRPEVLFNPDAAIGGCCEDFSEASLGLFEESLVPVGRTIEEMIFSSPNTKAWFDILKWVPTRSVAILTMVCRAWRAMVKDNYFIRSHVAHANLNKSPRIMMILGTTFGDYMDLMDIINGRGGYQDSTYLVCSQPCHGLNAGIFRSQSFVCNPIRGYVENITLDGVDNDALFAGQTGLGYSSQYNIHVLVLVTYKLKNFATRDYQLECKLRYVDEKVCRSIDPPPRPVADVAPTYVNEKIFWLVEPNLGPVSLSCEIIAFDLRIAQFEVLQGPPCSSHGNGHVSILRLHGALCMACSDKRSNVIDIWMMNDVGRWRMVYHIELEEFSSEYSSERTTPLAVDPMDGRILLSTGYSLGYYDPKMAALETIYRDVNHRCKFCPVIYEESFYSTLWDGSFLGGA